ncbi:acetyltransferase [Lactococcus cremoris subsp. cremoris IBB477]|uniref:Acetyltransferase n=1 Tax=Lactococcus cremoris subsp. cremoris IBB477 TaxID=1449093 RepID=A0A1E7G6A1_LACLC|nr:GNAT family N-acetyltransferase [Lactococcus cremoris]MCT0456353.1 GNAT family N-acetyltransferase [Lactococcus cremoris]OEU40467.1 acetyltransferase [Lactococcus cremoris subsp. cremoris IBB477]
MNTNTKDKKEYLNLATYAFHKPKTLERARAFDKLLEFSKAYGHYENEKLTSMLIDSHFRGYWGDKNVKISGIGYVASYPEYRGNGAIRQLMTESLREDYEEGTIFSYLAPFSYGFYEKFGYHYAFNQKHYKIPAQDFPKGQRTTGEISREKFEFEAEMSNGKTVSKSSEIFKVLTDIHQKAYNQGSLVRSEELWSYFFIHKSQPHAAIYRENGKALGYLLYEFSEMTFVIRELITLTDEAKQALYRFISSHAGSFSEIAWQAPANTLLEEEMIEPQRAEIKLVPYMQARIINLKEFLKVNGQPNFSVQITDDIIAENNMTIGEGKAEKMTIGQFTAKILKENQAILREYF